MPQSSPPPPPTNTPSARNWQTRDGTTWANDTLYSDVLHPNRPNVSKDELRAKLSELYKAEKDQVSCFGFRTQYGGGKSTGFALIYDSNEAMKKFEPHYRLVRYGQATKIEKPSRQQRTSHHRRGALEKTCMDTDGALTHWNRQAAQEQGEGVPWYREEDRWRRQEEEIDDSISSRYFWVMRLCAAFHYGFDTCMTGCKSKARTAFSHVVGVAT